MALRPLAFEEVKELLEMYRTKAAHTNANRQSAENILGSYIKWFEQDQFIWGLEIYTYKNNWLQHGLYMIVDIMNVMVNSLLNEDPGIAQALQSLRWIAGMKIIYIPENQYRTVYHCARRYPWDWRSTKMQVLRWPRESASLWHPPPIPMGLVFQPLHVSYAPEVVRIWPHIGTIQFVERLLRYNMSVALFSMVTGECVAWCIQRHRQYLSLMYVNPTFPSQRYLMKLVINQMVFQLTQRGLDIYTVCHRPVGVLRNLLKAINFMPIYQVYHLKSYSYDELNNERIMMHAANMW